MVVASTIAAIVPASAATPQSLDERVSTWDAAAARLGTAGSLWEPAYTADLGRTRRISVVADNVAVTATGEASGRTFAGTRYGTRSRGFVISEKWASTSWAAQPAVTARMARVGTARLAIGLPGTRVTVRATVYANCARRARCSRASVATTGGVLVMTARPGSTMTAPGDTSVVIESTGVSYDQLLRIARSVEQVAGLAGLGAGSAQMQGMCATMVSASMTPDQAQAYAGPLGYSVRVGSIDGQPQAVTMDYRPDRFTVAVVGGAVSSCTYG